MITHVAIRAADGTVYALPRPNRHVDLFRHFSQLRTKSKGGLFLTRDGQEQGFCADLDGFGEMVAIGRDELFLTRKQALAHVAACGQALTGSPGGVMHGELYSEGVW